MTTKVKLTQKMQSALKFANDHGGKIARYPGGFWMEEDFKSVAGRRVISFGTSTVEALVSRGLMVYSKWQEGKHRTFPIEATVTKSVLHSNGSDN